MSNVEITGNAVITPPSFEICRACLKHSSDDDINSNQRIDHLLETFEFCTSIKVNINDDFPHICDQCHNKLLCFNSFKKQCVASDFVLKQYVLTEMRKNDSQVEKIELYYDSPAADCKLKKVNEIATESNYDKEINVDSKENLFVPIKNEVQTKHTTETVTYNDGIVDDIQCDNLSNLGDEQLILNNTDILDNKAVSLQEYKTYPISKDEKTLQDDFCDLLSGNTFGENVEPHIISAASGRYNCGKCDRWYKHKVHFDAHIKSHETGIFILECDICFRRFDKPESFRLHKIAHAGIKQFECKVCGKGFVFKHRLTVHEKIHLKLERVPCKLCSKTFKTPTFLANHMSVHSEDRPFECEKCKKCFKTKVRINEHLKRCLGEKAHMCTLCGKCFVTTYDLKIHTRSHNGEKPLICPVCNKRFMYHGHLVVHKRSHTGERPYECHLCPKKFTIKRILDNHLLIHSGELPYMCSICGRSFRQRSALQTHMKIHNIIPQMKK